MTELHVVNGEAPTKEPPLLPAVAHRSLLRDVMSDTDATNVCAASALARVQQEIDYLWRDSLALRDNALTERLAQAGRGLKRIAQILDHASTSSSRNSAR